VVIGDCSCIKLTVMSECESIVKSVALVMPVHVQSTVLADQL
jgi:hypothetical protein